MNGHDGDALVLNSSVATAFGINIESDSENQFVVQLKRVRRETFSLRFFFRRDYMEALESNITKWYCRLSVLSTI